MMTFWNPEVFWKQKTCRSDQSASRCSRHIANRWRIIIVHRTKSCSGDRRWFLLIQIHSTWIWSVAMAGVENWQHRMLHRALNKLVFLSVGFKIISKNSESALEIYRNGLLDLQGGGVQEHQLRIVDPSWRANMHCVVVLCISSWMFVGFKFASEATHSWVDFFGTGRNNA